VVPRIHVLEKEEANLGEFDDRELIERADLAFEP
jgi:hypothetical protein